MSKTNALRKSRPIVRQTSEAKPSPDTLAILSKPSDSQPGLELSASEIARLRAFFELLDQWDWNQNEG